MSEINSKPCFTKHCHYWTPFGCGNDVKCIMNDVPDDKLKTERANILDCAKDIVCKGRNNTYGEPENNFAVIAELWSVYLDKRITAQDVGIMMTLFKLARIKTGYYKMDNYVDAAGYIACAGEIAIKDGD